MELPPNQPAPPVAQHYLAEIKYPNIPDAISIDKIFNVLQKIRSTSRPLQYKWQTLNKPSHGEIFLEQKYPLMRDPISGDQFTIIDDGYLWSSIPKPEIVEFQGQQIEMFKWSEGYSPGDQFFTVSKTEYRIKMPNNILFLIHYLNIKNPSIPVRSSLPATKISPIYLQQQFFQQLKQQLSAVSSLKRSPSPNQMKGNRMTASVNSNLSSNNLRINPSNSAANTILKNSNPSNTATASNIQRPPQTEGFTEASVDIFDNFGRYEAAFYRFNILKPFLTRLLESNPLQKQPQPPQNKIPEGLEKDLIAVIEKKISSQNEQMESFKSSKTKLLEDFKAEKEAFWEKYNRLLNGEDAYNNEDSIMSNHCDDNNNSIATPSKTYISL